MEDLVKIQNPFTAIYIESGEDLSNCCEYDEEEECEDGDCEELEDFNNTPVCPYCWEPLIPHESEIKTFYCNNCEIKVKISPLDISR